MFAFGNRPMTHKWRHWSVFLQKERKEGNMQLKNILCAMFALGIVGTAYAADEIITGGDGTCNETVLGTSENMATVDTIATWLLNDYDCHAGQYLNVDGDTVACTPCASGSYCPGGIFTVESENKGLNACPTNYTSKEGTSSEDFCYTQCEMPCVQSTCPGNAVGECVYSNTSKTGFEVYGAPGVCLGAKPEFCDIQFSCPTGHSKLETSWVEIGSELKNLGLDLANVSVDLIISCDSFSGDAAKCAQYGLDEEELFIAKFDPETKTAYFMSVQAVLVDMSEYADLFGGDISTVALDQFEYTSEALNGQTQTFTLVPGIVPLQSTRYYDMLAVRPYRFAKISETQMLEVANSFGIELDELIEIIKSGNMLVPMSDMVPKIPTDMPWIIYGNGTREDRETMGGAWGIMASTVFGISLMNDPSFSTRAYGEIPYSSCVVNKINIDWNPDDGSENISGMCLYGGDVNVPDYIPTKPGYTFKGWKLINQ